MLVFSGMLIAAAIISSEAGNSAVALFYAVFAGIGVGSILVLLVVVIDTRRMTDSSTADTIDELEENLAWLAAWDVKNPPETSPVDLVAERRYLQARLERTLQELKAQQAGGPEARAARMDRVEKWIDDHPHVHAYIWRIFLAVLVVAVPLLGLRLRG